MPLFGSGSRFNALGCLLAGALCASALPVSADEFASTRTRGLSESAHRIGLHFARDHAELTVQRSAFNAGSRSDQASWMIELPRGAVATALRTRSVGLRQVQWFVGELLEAELAAKRYQELTGIGGYYPKDPALLSWRNQSLLALQVFPCPARAEKVVEYTLKMPTEYRAGAYHVSLPALGTEQRLADLHVQATHAGDRVLADGVPLPRDGRVVLSRDHELDLALVPEAAPLEAELVSLPFAAGRVLTRYAIRAAPRLSRVPDHAYIVVVIDASRSTESGFESAAKSALDAYLSYFTDAHVEIMSFDRHVKRVLGKFVTVATARRTLSSLALSRENGSDVDQALYQADQLLADAPPGSPRRIVLVTDGLSRSTLSGERLRGALARSDALVHVGLLTSANEPDLHRMDDHPWAAALRTRHAMVWNAGAPTAPSPESKAQTTSVFEEWVRPLRIDNVGIFSDNQSVADRALDGLKGESLREGEGSEELFLDERGARDLSVTGELWVEPARVLASSGQANDELWAGLAFGSPLVDELAEPEMMTLATIGHAVSPVTSYLAIEPGVRPSTDGLELGVGEGHAFGMSGVYSGGGASDLSGHAPAIDRQAYLEQMLRPEYHRCGASLGQYSLDLETTRVEVVRVVVSARTGSPDQLVQACLSEAAWALTLPEGFSEDWEEFRVEQ